MSTVVSPATPTSTRPTSHRSDERLPQRKEN